MQLYLNQGEVGLSIVSLKVVRGFSSFWGCVVRQRVRNRVFVKGQLTDSLL
jgi:hypothetical protein